MRYKEAIKKLTPLLKNITHIPKKEVEILLLHLINKNIIWLYLNDDKECDCFDELEKLVKLRATNYPLEYITGQVTFYGEIFDIEEGVLIPRPETEILIEKVIEKFKNKSNLKIVEIGIGSGIISIILAKELDCNIVAVDINDKAINLSKKNIKKFNLENKIKVLKSNLFENINKSEKFDICISNPPYIQRDYKLPKNVEFEPKDALFSDEDGSFLLKQIATITKERGIKFLACEIGYNHKDIMDNYLKQLGYKQIDFYKDYSGFNRGFLADF